MRRHKPDQLRRVMDLFHVKGILRPRDVVLALYPNDPYAFSRVQGYFRILIERGLVEKIDRGTYRLLPHSNEATEADAGPGDPPKPLGPAET